MWRKIASICMAAVMVAVSSVSVCAADVDELLLYMGIKIEYVWKEVSSELNNAEVGNVEAGNVSHGSPGYIFTTKDTPELIAQALSNNHPSVTAGFIRQLPMRDLMKALTAVKSAADILSERGRDDLLALAYLGNYVAPEKEYISFDPGGDAQTFIPASNSNDIPGWASKGDIGNIGERAAVPVLGNVRLRSVFGEVYVLGTRTYGKDEVVYDTPRGASVKAVFNGYVSYAGSGIVELRTYDQRLVIRYRGVEPNVETVVGKVYTQGDDIGLTSDFGLGVSMSIDGIERNILQVYTETLSKQWFEVWSRKNPGYAEKLVLKADDSNYHMTARQLNKNNPNSYTNPEMFGVDPSTVDSDTDN